MILALLLPRPNEIACFSRSEPGLANEYLAYRMFHFFNAAKIETLIFLCELSHITLQKLQR